MCFYSSILCHVLGVFGQVLIMKRSVQSWGERAPTVPSLWIRRQEGSVGGIALDRSDQGATFVTSGAPLARVLPGQGTAHHAIHLPSTVCSATCDPLGQSRRASDHMPRALLRGAVVGRRKPKVTRPTYFPSNLSVGFLYPVFGARSTGHTQTLLGCYEC